MNNRRFPIFLVIIAVIALLFVGQSMGAQSAWTDGFIMGQLTSGADGATVAYAMQNGGRMGGGSPFLGFLAFGALFFGGMMVLRTLRFRAMGMMADGPSRERWSERMKHWEGRHGGKPPWAAWTEESEKAAQPEAPTADAPKPDGDGKA
jgi:hypothetical protein